MTTVYEHAGGDQALHRLEEAFCSAVLADPVLKTLFTERRPHHAHFAQEPERGDLPTVRAGEPIDEGHLEPPRGEQYGAGYVATGPRRGGGAVGCGLVTDTGQYATPIACLSVAGSSSTASMRWATSAREIE
jgi:hypothetical protein